MTAVVAAASCRLRDLSQVQCRQPVTFQFSHCLHFQTDSCHLTASLKVDPVKLVSRGYFANYVDTSCLVCALFVCKTS